MSSNVVEINPDKEPQISEEDIVGIISDIAHKLETLCLMLRYFGWNEPVSHLEDAIEAIYKLTETKN